MQSIRQYRALGAQEKQRAASTSAATTASSESHTASSLGKEESERTFDAVPRLEKKTGQILVSYSGPDDPLNAKNWSLASRIGIASIIFVNVFSLDWSAAADSRLNTSISEAFDVGEVVETLSPALYVVGIALGALFAGPVSETCGRNPVYIYSRIFNLAFLLGPALAQNIQTQLICRFFAGLGASMILAIHGASLADIFGRHERSLAWPIVALGSFLGTVCSPIVGGWISFDSAFVSWRWAEWIAVIISGFTFVITFLFLPETFGPILLKWKAEHLRRETGDTRYISELELEESFAARLKVALHRAMLMTTHEPIVVLLGLWLVIVYVVVYGFLQGFKYIYQYTFEFSDGALGTAFAAIAVGLVLNTSLALPLLYYHRRRAERWEANSGGNSELPPEYRLVSAFLVAFTFPISMFWLGWTSFPRIGPWSDLGATALFGFSWAGIYVSIYQYILDVYGIYAGSALASITFFRYLVSGGIVVASTNMYEAMGVHWVFTMLGCIAAVLAVAPFIFFKYGERIRARSRFASRYMQKEETQGPEGV